MKADTRTGNVGGKLMHNNAIKLLSNGCGLQNSSGLRQAKKPKIGPFINGEKAMRKSSAPDLVDTSGVTAVFMSIPSFQSMHYSGNTPCTHHPSRQPILFFIA